MKRTKGNVVTLTKTQQDSLVKLVHTLETYWDDLPVDVITSWEDFENTLPNGKFRDRLRG